MYVYIVYFYLPFLPLPVISTKLDCQYLKLEKFACYMNFVFFIPSLFFKLRVYKDYKNVAYLILYVEGIISHRTFLISHKI
jgi:hypothetical protein